MPVLALTFGQFEFKHRADRLTTRHVTAWLKFDKQFLHKFASRLLARSAILFGVDLSLSVNVHAELLGESDCVFPPRQVLPGKEYAFVHRDLPKTLPTRSVSPTPCAVARAWDEAFVDALASTAGRAGDASRSRDRGKRGRANAQAVAAAATRNPQ